MLVALLLESLEGHRAGDAIFEQSELLLPLLPDAFVFIVIEVVRLRTAGLDPVKDGIAGVAKAAVVAAVAVSVDADHVSALL